MKKCLAAVLALTMATGLLGCSKNDQSQNNGSNAEDTTKSGALLDGGITNPTGYPITKEKITLEAAVIYGAHKGDFSKYDYWKDVAEKSNIELKFRVLNDKENVNLMFASRDFPDLAFSTGVTATMLSDTVESGDIVRLDDNLKEFAPNYDAFFEKNKDIKALMQEKDGNIYSLPYVSLAEWDFNMRDVRLINGNWLKELNMKMPTTLEEFTAYLRAVKANAGKGTIPANVTPYYLRHNQNIGGPFEIFASFGLQNGNANGFTPFIQDGKVVNNATNPEIKEPIKYLRMLYSEGLIPPEAFTDDNGAYTAKLTAVPAVVGSITAYGNNSVAHWEYMPPLQAVAGKQPQIRPQRKSAAKNFMIFKKNKYPIATLRLGDMFAETEWSVYGNWGAEGIGYTKTANGEYRKIMGGDIQEDDAKKTPGNYGLSIQTEDLHKQLSTEVINDPRSREYAYYNIYKKFLPSGVSLLPNIPSYLKTQEESDKLAQITTDTDSYINKMMASWITGKSDVDAEWDEYIKKLNDMGMKERISITQKHYDAFMAGQKK